MKILIVEDDEKLRKAIQFQLNESGINTEGCADGDEALYLIRNQLYDVIVLDRMLPQMDGLTILHTIRAEQIKVPVIMVTALNGIDDRIDGLEGGADDYLAKPFEMRELVARIHALARRPANLQHTDELHVGNVTLDLMAKTLHSDQGQCILTVKEAELLEILLKNKNQIMTREVLLNRVWGLDSYVTESNLDNFIYFIRRRINSVNGTIRIATVRGVGYRLEEMKHA